MSLRSVARLLQAQQQPVLRETHPSNGGCEALRAVSEGALPPPRLDPSRLLRLARLFLASPDGLPACSQVPLYHRERVHLSAWTAAGQGLCVERVGTCRAQADRRASHIVAGGCATIPACAMCMACSAYPACLLGVGTIGGRGGGETLPRERQD